MQWTSSTARNRFFMGARVDSILEGSLFVGTDLCVGMIIHTVERKNFASKEELTQLFADIRGKFTIYVDTQPTIGTSYVVRRKNGGGAQHTVFIPNAVQEGGGGENLHCQSDYKMHTAFWIRDRYIQRALMDHPTRSMNDVTTMHSRWHITRSPLYQIVRDDMIEMMEIPGLGDASLPAFLATSAAASEATEQQIDQDDADDAEMETRVFAPKRMDKRYTDTNTVASKIVDMAKRDPKVYEMVLPQLQKMYQNCVMLLGNKSEKVVAAKATAGKSGKPIAIIPASIRRSSSDDVNQANRKRKA